MTSARKIAANWANSRLSTGPKSRKGKSRAAQNAHRHGLSLSVLLNPSLSKEVEDLAQKVAGGSRDPEALEAARLLAEALVDLERIYRVRYDYLRRYRGHLNSTAWAIGSMSSEKPSAEELRSLKIPEQARRYILEQLLKIDRYEMRARSRRKYAARMLTICLGAAKRRKDISNSSKWE